jgi:mRNA interferase MazF
LNNPDRVPARGEIWRVNFEPQVGDEIMKTRPAVVMNVRTAWRLRLHIVVPLTGWQPDFVDYFWMIQIKESPTNNLTKNSGADAFQVKSVSESRFVEPIGSVTPEELDNIAAAIALCVGL